MYEVIYESRNQLKKIMIAAYYHAWAPINIDENEIFDRILLIQNIEITLFFESLEASKSVSYVIINKSSFLNNSYSDALGMRMSKELFRFSNNLDFFIKFFFNESTDF